MTSRPDPDDVAHIFREELRAVPTTTGHSESPARGAIFPGWAELGLADPPLDGKLPANAETADVLSFILMPPGTVEPVEGLIDGVRLEVQAQIYHLQRLDRQLEAAMLFRRRIDGRAPAPSSFRAEEDRVRDRGAPGEPLADAG